MKSKIMKHKFLYAVLGLIIILVFVGVTVVAANWNRPLSQGLELPTHVITATLEATEVGNGQVEELALETPVVESIPTDALEGIEIAPTPTILPTDQPTPEPMCGGPMVMTILGIGVDTSDDEYFYGLADVVRIARIDFVTPKVSVLAIPRDIWVKIPRISDHYGITEGKLNQAYFYGTKAMGYYDGPGAGPGLMSLTLVENFGLYVDKYGTVNMSTLARMIDAVGGIDIYVPESVDGREQGLGFFSAGQQHFTGEEAIRFSRIRYQDSDIQRIDRQTQVLYALQDKVLSPSVLPRIPKIIASFRDSIITDLSPKDISNLTCLLPHIRRDNLVYTRLPEHLLTPKWRIEPHSEKETWTWDWDYEAIRRLIGYYQSGNWPVK